MIRRGLLAILLTSSTAVAAEGSWSSQSFGGTLSLGKQTLTSRAIQVSSSLPAGAVAQRVAWKISTDRHTPVGFQAKICGGGRCLPLPGMAGEIPLPAGFPAGGPFHFEYTVAVRGPLHPALTVLSNQLTVHYHTLPPRRAKG